VAKKPKHLIAGTKEARANMAYLRSLRSPIRGINQPGHHTVSFDHTHTARPPRKRS